MGDLPLGVKHRVVRQRKIDLCADLEDVRLDPNHLKMGAGCFLKGILGGFWVLVRSPEVKGE